mgnify:CR=1 FL=1
MSDDLKDLLIKLLEEQEIKREKRIFEETEQKNQTTNPKDEVNQILLKLFNTLSEQSTKDSFRGDPNVALLSLIGKKTKEYLKKTCQLKHDEASNNPTKKEREPTPLNTGLPFQQNNNAATPMSQ